MIGKTISHYKILEKLGEGSMGKVYKAEDTKLKRIVALKFLPHHLIAGKTVKQRFFHEARSASALNHPNIITIYDIHEEDGEVFIAMECVDGELLSDKLKDGPLKQKELINISSGIADGLNAAHNADITHRDIKSDNIIISKDGTAKILDFGLAKQKGMSQITQDGTTLGTQAYMSPEQVQSSKIDQRSDIFSFGVVMYQMATGKLPFEGEHEAAILYSIVNEAPIPTTTLNPNIDEELQRVISKALEKDVKDRYQHADDILTDLRKLKKGTTPKPTKTKAPIWRIPAYIFGALLIATLLFTTILKKDTEPTLGNKSIAVLPFTTIDRTEESEIFGEGIHDDILTQIAKIGDLKVIARTSMLKYKNTEKSIKEIAEELNVNTILEGSVRRSGDRIRIVTQLIDPATEEHLWAETYDREYSDIFTIQSDVAKSIASSLQASLTPQEIKTIEEIPTKSIEAYEYYLQGKIVFNKFFDYKYLKESIDYFNKAIALDSNFVMAYSMLCRAYVGINWNRFGDYPEYIKYAENALNKAKSINSDHPSVLIAEGYYYYHGFRDYDKALNKFHSVLQKHPNNSDLIAAIAYVYRRQGKWKEALELLIKATDIDPNAINKVRLTGLTAHTLRNWDLADRYFDRAILLNPSLPYIYDHKVRVAIGRGDINSANEIVEEALKHVDSQKLIGTRADVEYYNRNIQKALEIRQEYKETEDSDFYSRAQDLGDKGLYSNLIGDKLLSAVYYDSLITLCNRAISQSSDNWFARTWRAIAYSQIGRKDEALKEAKIVAELMSIERDADSGAGQFKGIIEIYMFAGEYEEAITTIDFLLSIPSSMSVNRLKLAPLFDPLRDNPRFQELIKKYEHTEG